MRGRHRNPRGGRCCSDWIREDHAFGGVDPVRRLPRSRADALRVTDRSRCPVLGRDPVDPGAQIMRCLGRTLARGPAQKPEARSHLPAHAAHHGRREPFQLPREILPVALR